MRNIYYIDLFSGAGGTTTGIHMVGEGVKVVACVNHDTMAIESHKANHPDCLHFIEDVRDFKVIKALKKLVAKLRKNDPTCLIAIWASLECTNYSKAKGGQPRDADSRTLAHALYRRYSMRYKRYVKGYGYIQELKPDFIDIENVREFMSWGPLDENGKPISKLNGIEYLRWVKAIKSLGYNYDFRILDSADFGAYTSRERYFGQFAKIGLPIIWPEQTHSKTIKKHSLFSQLEKWKPVREVLNLNDEGESIFTKDTPLVENSLKRIYAGLVKFVGDGNDIFIQKNFSGHPESKVISINGPAHTITAKDHHSPVFIKRYNGGNPEEKVKSIEQPIGAISTNNRHAIVKPCFLTAHYKTGNNIHSLDKPCPTIPTKDRFQKINPVFLMDYHGNSKHHSLDKPCPTILTKDKYATIRANFITNYYSGGGQLSDIDQPSPTITSIPKQRLNTINFIDQQFGNSKPHDIDRPAGTITTNPKQNLITAKSWLLSTNFNNIGSSLNDPAPVITANRKWSYLINPSWFGAVSSINKPAPVIIARQDKAPLGIVNTTESNSKLFAMPIFNSDSETMFKIKTFMAIHRISDIKMRMLNIDELLRIQGFPDNYILKGSKTKQKKYIGNAVVPIIAKAIIKSKFDSVQREIKIAL